MYVNVSVLAARRWEVEASWWTMFDLGAIHSPGSMLDRLAGVRPMNPIPLSDRYRFRAYERISAPNMNSTRCECTNRLKTYTGSGSASAGPRRVERPEARSTELSMSSRRRRRKGHLSQVLVLVVV